MQGGGGGGTKEDAAGIDVEHQGPEHSIPCLEISWRTRHTRRLCTFSQVSGGAAPTDRCNERPISSEKPPRGAHTKAFFSVDTWATDSVKVYPI